MKSWTIRKLLEETRNYLIKKNVSEPRLSSELLLAEILNMKRLDLYLKFDRIVDADELDRYREFIKRRLKGEPIQYIIGKTEFFGLTFRVNENVLIPRPESEFLVEKAVDYFKKKEGGTVIDIGTGSGAIGISIAYYSKDVNVVLSDISDDAAKLTAENAKNLLEDESRFSVKTGDLYDAVEEQADVVVANLPYLNDEQMNNLQREVQSEPSSALYGGKNGIEIIKRLIESTNEHIVHGGKLILEFDEAGKTDMDEFLNAKGLEYNFYKDYNSIYRYCIIDY